MAEQPNRVEYVENGRRWIVPFPTAREAYHFWLWLPRDMRAWLYQGGELSGEGDRKETAA